MSALFVLLILMNFWCILVYFVFLNEDSWSFFFAKQISSSFMTNSRKYSWCEVEMEVFLWNDTLDCCVLLGFFGNAANEEYDESVKEKFFNIGFLIQLKKVIYKDNLRKLIVPTIVQHKSLQKIHPIFK